MFDLIFSVISVKSSPLKEIPFSSSRWSALNLDLQDLQSIKGSLNLSMCPEVSHTLLFKIIEESNCTTLACCVMNSFFHAALMLSFNIAPSGP